MFKKSRLKPWQRKQWCIGVIDGEYLACMENVLELYAQPVKVARVRLCLDERPCQLLKDVYMPLPMKKGRPACQDYDRVAGRYERQGSCVVFMIYDMDTGVRYGKVSQRRTKADYAVFVEEVLAQHYPQVEAVDLVQDNLNTHKYGSFYEYLPLETATQLRRLITFYYTPKHASWLNMVEIEFSALSRQCLDRRIGSVEQLNEQIQPWIDERNQKQVKIHWSFTVKDAREKLGSQYQKICCKN